MIRAKGAFGADRPSRTSHPRGPDLLDVVEAAYDLDDAEGDERWARRIVDAFHPHLDRGMGVGSYFSEPERSFEALVGIDLPDGWERAMAALMGSSIGPRLLRPPRPATTASRGVGERRWLASEAMRTFWAPQGVVDGIGLVADDGSHRMVTFFAPLSTLGALSPRLTTQYERVLSHISAGWRLRRSLRHAAAVLTPSGAIVHAEGEAREVSARELLRRAAQAVERARGPLRRADPDEALALWQVLTAGTWSLVDQFESDGRRYLVAHENAPRPDAPRILSLREQQVLAYTALGHSLKLMSYELGGSISAISKVRARALRKLSLRSPGDVAHLLARSAPLLARSSRR